MSRPPSKIAFQLCSILFGLMLLVYFLFDGAKLSARWSFRLTSPFLEKKCDPRRGNATEVPISILKLSDLVGLDTREKLLKLKLHPVTLVLPSELESKLDETLAVELETSHGNLLIENPDLDAVSLRSSTSDQELCKLEKINWTIHISHGRPQIQDGIGTDWREKLKGFCCHPCDLLSPIFLIRTEAIVPFLKELAVLGGSGYLFLSEKLKGRIGSCPVQSTSFPASSANQVLCADLPIPFDRRFRKYPKVTGIWRLTVAINSVALPREYWLGCIWSSKALSHNLAISCTNWMRVLFLDAVDLMERYGYKNKYRLAFGQLIGVLRDKNVPPWMVDVDITVPISGKEFSHFAEKGWTKGLKIKSNYLYDAVDENNDRHLTPIRGFRRCPMLFTHPAVQPDKKDSEIESLLFGDQVYCNSTEDDWKSPGYMDIYSKDQGTATCPSCGKIVNSERYESIEVLGRAVNIPINAKSFVECCYRGKDVLTKYPKGYDKEWKCFV